MTQPIPRSTEMQVDQLMTALQTLAAEQLASGCLVYVRTPHGKLYPLTGVEYDPGVEPETVEEKDEDGLEVEIEEDEGEEATVILTVGNALI